jgi:hypothetical protein
MMIIIFWEMTPCDSYKNQYYLLITTCLENHTKLINTKFSKMPIFLMLKKVAHIVAAIP